MPHLTAPDLAHWRRHCNVWTVNQCRLFRCGPIVSFAELKIRSFSLLMAAIESIVIAIRNSLGKRSLQTQRNPYWLRLSRRRGSPNWWCCCDAEVTDQNWEWLLAETFSQDGVHRYRKLLYIKVNICIYCNYVPTEYPPLAPHYLSKPD